MTYVFNKPDDCSVAYFPQGTVVTKLPREDYTEEDHAIETILKLLPSVPGFGSPVLVRDSEGKVLAVPDNYITEIKDGE